MLKDIAPKGRAKSVRNARTLRANMTLPEVLLWQALRSQSTGLKFRRQHPSGPFILDFFCSDARLAMEIDGEAHCRGDRPERDEVRDAWLLKSGIETLRIPAVLHDLDEAVLGILAAAFARLPLHHALRARSPSPSKLGEELPLHHPASPGGPPPRGKLGEER